MLPGLGAAMGDSHRTKDNSYSSLYMAGLRCINTMPTVMHISNRMQYCSAAFSTC